MVATPRVTTVTCHTTNIFAKYYFKAKDGMNHVRKFVTFNERQAITAEDASAGVIMDNCIRCHTQLNQEFVRTGRINYMMAKRGEGSGLLGLPSRCDHMAE